MGSSTSGARIVKTLQKITRTSAKSAKFEVGIVKDTSPLKILVGEKKLLTKGFLFLSPFCKLTKMKISGTEYTLWRGLKKGDKVIILTDSSGQFHYVLQRQEGIL